MLHSWPPCDQQHSRAALITRAPLNVKDWPEKVGLVWQVPADVELRGSWHFVGIALLWGRLRQFMETADVPPHEGPVSKGSVG